MRTYKCVCGNSLFYDNSQCVACGADVGFCPQCRQMSALLLAEVPTASRAAPLATKPTPATPAKNTSTTSATPSEPPLQLYRCGNSSCGALLQKCCNYAIHNVCNRCVLALGSGPGIRCDCCRFNDTIPDLSVAGNLRKWYRLEAAKRRLFYDLDHLGLPYGTESDGVQPPLAFDFKADVIPKNDFWRKTGKKEQVYTGHANGRITINIREADDVEREKLRVEFGEAQRTLIGHFRHEIGHYYWQMLVEGRREAEFVSQFGDHNQPTYAEALEAHYRNGPPADWQEQYISPYATVHPWEDFAETWASYLDMVSALDTAEHHGFGGHAEPLAADAHQLLLRYQQLGIALNEINRSLGLLDVVPEVFVPPIARKMQFIHDLVRQARAENPILAPPAATGPRDRSPGVSQAPSGSASAG